MKEYIENMLDKSVDKEKTTHHATITKFREVMLNHFKKLHLSEKTTRMVKTAAMLDPKHIRLSYQSEIDVNEFIDHIEQIVKADNTIGKEPETQMIGPSQPPVSLNMNIPKTQEKNNNDDSATNGRKHEYAKKKLFPSLKCRKENKKKHVIVRTTIREQVTNEVEYYLSCVENQNEQIQEKCESEKGFDVSKWWAFHNGERPYLYQL